MAAWSCAPRAIPILPPMQRARQHMPRSKPWERAQWETTVRVGTFVPSVREGEFTFAPEAQAARDVGMPLTLPEEPVANITAQVERRSSAASSEAGEEEEEEASAATCHAGGPRASGEEDCARAASTAAGGAKGR